MKPQSCTITYIPSLILDFNNDNMRSTKTVGENEICTLKRSNYVHNSTHHWEDTPSNLSFCSPCHCHQFLNQDGIQVETSDNCNRGLMNVKAPNIHSEVSVYFQAVYIQSIHTYIYTTTLTIPPCCCRIIQYSWSWENPIKVWLLYFNYILYQKSLNRQHHV